MNIYRGGEKTPSGDASAVTDESAVGRTIRNVCEIVRRGKISLETSMRRLMTLIGTTERKFGCLDRKRGQKGTDMFTKLCVIVQKGVLMTLLSIAAYGCELHVHSSLCNQKTV